MTAENIATGPRTHTTDDRVSMGGVDFDAVTERDVLDLVADGWRRGQGGLIVTPNVDIVRRVQRDAQCRALVARARLVVADGMPIIWASRLSGAPLPERVTGSSLVESLCGLAGQEARSVFIVGGGLGSTAERATTMLARRHPGLKVAGAIAPAFGFEQDEGQLRAVREAVVGSAADLVLVGLGFPKQERLAEVLLESMPGAWFLGCGAGVAMAAGETRRPPQWAQTLGVEWLARLAQEPRRLAKRYLVDDIPTALGLLTRSALRRRA